MFETIHDLCTRNRVFLHNIEEVVKADFAYAADLNLWIIFLPLVCDIHLFLVWLMLVSNADSILLILFNELCCPVREL